MVKQNRQNSFKSTAATNIYDQAVNTYVNPVSVLPETGIMGVARALQNNNPTLQKYLGSVIEEEKQKGIMQGEIEVLMASPERLKEITDALKTQDKNVAKNVLSKNIFVRAGIEKRLAINHGLSQEGKLNNFLNNKLIEVEGEDGSIRQVPLKEFDVSSPEFKNAINDFHSTERADLTGIRPEFVNNYFMPEAAVAVKKAYINQEKNNQEFVANLQNSSFTDTVLANFSTIDFTKLEDIDVTNPDSKINKAIDNINKEVKYLDSIGATSTVSPKGMTTNALHLAEIIFDINLRKGKSGVVAVRNFKNVVGQIKVGPKITLEDGTVIQDTLMKYLGEDWNKMMNRFITAENNYDTFKEKKINKIIKPRIVEALKDFKFTIEGPSGETIRNTEALNKLALIFKDTPDAFLDVIEDLDISRDEFYDEFAVKIINQNFASPLQALNELRKFELSLGKTITEEDTTELNALKDMITTHLGKDRLALYRPRISELIKSSKEILGGNDQANPWRKRFNVDIFYYDSTARLNQEIIRISKTAKTSEEFEEGIENAMKNYRKEILRLNSASGSELRKFKLNESGAWYEAEQELLNEKKADSSNKPPIKVTQTEFDKLKDNGKIAEDDDGSFYRINDGRKINIIEEKETEEDSGTKGWLKNLFSMNNNEVLYASASNQIPIQETQPPTEIKKEEEKNILAGEGKSEIPTEGGEDMNRQSGGVLKNNLDLKLLNFDKFEGAVSYGSAARGTNLKNDKNFIIEISENGYSHSYADKSSKEVINKAKEIYIDLVMNNTPKNIEVKYAIAQMVLTEANLSSEDDIFGVMQSVLMRVARARLGVSEYPYGVYSKDIIEEMLRPYQYVGLADAGVTTKEQLLEKTPIKENEETLKRVIDILWDIDPTGSKVIF